MYGDLELGNLGSSNLELKDVQNSDLGLGNINDNSMNLGDMSSGDLDLDLDSIGSSSPNNSTTHGAKAAAIAGTNKFVGGVAKTVGEVLKTDGRVIPKLKDIAKDVGNGDISLIGGMASIIHKVINTPDVATDEDNIFTIMGNKADEFANEAFTKSRRYTPTIESYHDINTLGDLGSYVGEGAAGGIPEIGSYFLRRFTLPIQALSYVGQTLDSQEQAGNNLSLARAGITGVMEAALNSPITGAASKILEQIGGTALTKAMKVSVTKDILHGIATDASVNGAQQILRNYGIDGQVSLKNIDEAIVGGIVVALPLRSMEAFSNKHIQNQLTDSLASNASKSGDIKGADGVLQTVLSYTAGKALRPVRRIMSTEAGKKLFSAVDNMRTNREVMANHYAVRISDLFDKVKSPDDLAYNYSKGDRSTPELKELGSIMESIHKRSNDSKGANLKIGFIENYLPTLFDAEDFNIEQRANLHADYTEWYYKQTRDVKTAAVKPAKAKKVINAFGASLSKERGVTRLPRASLDENGDFIAASKISVRSPLKMGMLEKSRVLGFIPQRILNDYAVPIPLKEHIEGYTQSAAQRVTYAEQMGGKNEKLNGLVSIINKTLPVDKKLISSEVNTIYDAMDAYQGMHNQFQNKTLRKSASLLRSMSNIVALPLTALSSMTEPFGVAIKVGNIKAVQAFAGALGSMSRDLMSTITHGLVEKSDVNKQLRLVGRSFHEATAMLSNRMQGDVLSKGMTHFNEAFFHATGQTVINYLVNSMGVHALKSQLRDDVVTIVSAKGTRGYEHAMQRMKDVGVTESMVKRFHTEPKYLREQMPYMISKFNREVALNPTSLDKPNWMSTGWGAMFSQLRSYPTMLTNTVLPKFAKMVDPRGKSSTELAIGISGAMTTVGAMVGVSFIQEVLKNKVRGGDKSDDEILITAINNSVTPIQIGQLSQALSGRGFASIFSPAAAGIVDKTVSSLQRAANGKATISDIPIISSFKGLID